MWQNIQKCNSRYQFYKNRIYIQNYELVLKQTLWKFYIKSNQVYLETMTPIKF